MDVQEFLSNYYLMNALDGKSAKTITEELITEVGQFALNRSKFSESPIWKKIEIQMFCVLMALTDIEENKSGRR